MELKGVIPEYENRVSDLLKSVKIGSSLPLNPQEPCRKNGTDCTTPQELPPIVLGKDLAETIGATVGSIILVTSPQGELTPFGLVPKYERFKVVGVFSSGFYNYDSAWGFIRLADAQRLVGLGDWISVIGFTMSHPFKTTQAGPASTTPTSSRFRAATWMETNRALF